MSKVRQLALPLRRQTIIETVGTYGNQLLRFIRGKVRTNEDAEDILQDVWYQYSNVNEIEAIESVSGWLYRVAKNKITATFFILNFGLNIC